VISSRLALLFGSLRKRFGDVADCLKVVRKRARYIRRRSRASRYTEVNAALVRFSVLFSA